MSDPAELSGPAEVVITGAPVPLRTALADLVAHRALVRAFAVRSLRVRYRQAVLGVAWAIGQPLALLVPFVVLLDRGSDSARAPVAATLAALTAWQFAQGALSSGAGALVQEAVLVRKSWFPREAPVLAAVAVAALELCLGLVVYAAVCPFLGARLGWGVIAAPGVAIVLVAVVTALVLPLAALDAVFRDVRHGLPFALLLLLFLSPVAYSLDRFSPGHRLLLAFANPLAGPIEGLRRCLAFGRFPDPALLGASALSAVVLGWFGARLFARLAPVLPDVI